MNRPFCAFGALLGLLALAMYAVSSSSRSTSVQNERPARTPAITARSMPRPAYVATQPEPMTDCDGGEDGEFIEERSGSLSSAEPLTSLAPVCGSPRAEMKTARVASAQNPQAGWRELLVLDCRAHSDPAYDRLIYGVSDADLPRLPAAKLRQIDEVTSLDGDWLTTFEALVTPPRDQPAAPSLKANFPWHRLRAVAVSFQTWLSIRADELRANWTYFRPTAPRPTTGLGWREYAELIDQAAARFSASPVSATTSDAQQSVRSSGWLRHSAASSLYQMGLFLQAAGLKLNRGGESLFQLP